MTAVQSADGFGAAGVFAPGLTGGCGFDVKGADDGFRAGASVTFWVLSRLTADGGKHCCPHQNSRCCDTGYDGGLRVQGLKTGTLTIRATNGSDACAVWLRIAKN